MKITTGLLAGVAVLAVAQTAHAAPRVAGKYVLMSFTQCRAEFTTTMGNNYRLDSGVIGSAVRILNAVDDGEVNIAVGSISFSPSASGAGASSGTATLEMSIVAGPSLRINTASGNVGTHTETASGAFNITSDTFTFDGMTWTLRAGNFKGQTANTVAKTLYLTRRENAKCISAVTATKELP